MKSFAAVNSQGLITYTVTPAVDDAGLYKEGDLKQDGFVFIELSPEQSDHTDVVERYYYDFASKTFIERGPSPSLFHYWHEGAWVHDIPLLTHAETTRRNALLAATDWTQLSDVVLDNVQVWLDYRQALRDVPSQSGFPADISWPSSPVSSALPESTLSGVYSQPGFSGGYIQTTPFPNFDKSVMT